MHPLSMPYTLNETSKALLIEAASLIKTHKYADNTKRAYAADITDFQNWSEQQGLAHFLYDSFSSTADHGMALSAVIAYITHLKTYKKHSTIARRIAAISRHYKGRAFNPCTHVVVKDLLAAIKKLQIKAGTGVKQAQAILTSDIIQVLQYGYIHKTAKGKVSQRRIKRSSLKGLRDVALLLIGFTGALRRSELVELHYEDLQHSQHGYVIRIRNSKTDKHLIGQEIAIRTLHSTRAFICPVRALQAWLKAANISTGKLWHSIGKGDKLSSNYLHSNDIDRLVKQYFQYRLNEAGELVKLARISAHSLRSGFVTQARLNGASDAEIMKQTRHKSPSQVYRYTRFIDIWRANAVDKLGL
jgi:integrase